MLTNEQIKLIWTGVPYDPTGYGAEARGFIGMLDQYRLNLKIIPQSFHQGEDSLTPEQKVRFAELERTAVQPGQAIVVHHLPANLFNEQLRGRINIGRTMFETDRIPCTGWGDATGWTRSGCPAIITWKHLPVPA